MQEQKNVNLKLEKFAPFFIHNWRNKLSLYETFIQTVHNPNSIYFIFNFLFSTIIKFSSNEK